MSQTDPQFENPVNDVIQPASTAGTSNDSLAVRENLYFGTHNNDDDDQDLDGYFTSHQDTDDDDETEEIDEIDDDEEVEETPRITPQRIAELINLLDSSVFSNRGDNTRPPGRIQAQQLLEAAGMVALPQLVQGLANQDATLEQHRRTQSAIDHIVRNMTPEQLLSLRNPETRTPLINNNVTRALDQAAMTRVAQGLEAASAQGMGEHLATPSWMNAMRFSHKNKFGEVIHPPSEETVRQWDRMNTPQGQADVANRLQQLAGMLGTGRLSAAERQTVANQIMELGTYSSPESIGWGRTNARTGLAEVLHAANPQGNAQRVQQLMIEAHQMQGAEQRSGTIKQMINMGLDQNPAFMQALETRAGRDAVQAVVQQRELMAQNRGLGNKQ